MPTVNLDTNDANELAELLQFLHDWLGADPGRLSQSLTDFAGSSAYNVVELRADFKRFTFLLGTGDDEGLFSAKAEWRSDGPPLTAPNSAGDADRTLQTDVRFLSPSNGGTSIFHRLPITLALVTPTVRDDTA